MSGRSTTGGPKVPHYVRAPHIEAAKHLRLTVTRYITDRASLAEVENAMVQLRAVAPVPGDRVPPPKQPLEVDCPRCGVAPGESCQGTHAKHGLLWRPTIKRPHRERVDLARGVVS